VMTASSLPSVLVVSLGGTITMTSSEAGGIRPTLTADQLLATVPGLAKIAKIETLTPMSLPGASLTLAKLSELARLLRQRLDGKPGSPVGAVVIQGTDTIEDTAFVLDLLACQGDAPVVVTGAMRGPQAPGADGPANLLAAVTVASAPSLRGRGAVVVLNDEIHAARWVQKMHTSLTSAFESPGAGRIGLVAEGQVHLHAQIQRTQLLPAARLPALDAAPATQAVAQVALGLGEDGRLLKALPGLGYQGAVIEAMGAGHVPAATVEALNTLAQQMPVVLTTRVRAGRVFTATYGFPGSEMDLIARGLLPGGFLTAAKARLLLSLLLTLRADPAEIKAAFAYTG